MGKLDGKTALITGGAGGIGKVTGEIFLKEGANVVLVDLNEDSLLEAKSDLQRFGKVLTIQADVSKVEDVKKYVKETVREFGSIDVFFNNAGIVGKSGIFIVDQEVEVFDILMSVNVRGVFLGLKYVLPVMIQQQSGSVINTSSMAGLMGSTGNAPYTTSKHAVVGLTKTAALEVADKNIRVNSIHPGPVNTQMMRTLEKNKNQENPESVRDAFRQSVPLGRYADPIEIAKLVLFLASDDSSFVTGAQYRIDGGVAAK